jgi:glycosyltransferase involved in cell wall biosynthesis
MQRICESLSSFGYNVILCGRELQHSLPLTTKKFEQHRLRCYFNKGKLFYIEFNIRLFFFLLKHHFDAVNAVDLDTALAALFSSKLKQKKLIYDAHELFTEVPEVVNRPFTKKVWEWVEALFVPRTNLAYTVSQSIANVLSQKHHKQFFVIRNVPLLTQQKAQQKERAIIYQGALNEGRGLEFLIQAMQAIDAQLWIAGDGDIAQKLKIMVQQLNLENKVLFLGKLSPEKLAEKTQQAIAGFNALEPKGLSYYYSLSNKTFDYIHAEIPQVISAFPEMKKLNEQFHFAIEINNLSPLEISNAFNGLLSDEKLCETLSKNCAKAKQILNWQSESQQLKKIYEQLLG